MGNTGGRRHRAPTPAAPHADDTDASNAPPPNTAATGQASADQSPGNQAPRPSRRDFLIGAGTASVAAAGAAYITWDVRNEKLAAPVRPRANRVAELRPVVTAAPRPTRSDWRA